MVSKRYYLAIGLIPFCFDNHFYFFSFFSFQNMRHLYLFPLTEIVAFGTVERIFISISSDAFFMSEDKIHQEKPANKIKTVNQKTFVKGLIRSLFRLLAGTWVRSSM